MGTWLPETRKGKAVPLQAWAGPEGFRKLRLPDFVTTAQDGGRLSALRTDRLLPPGNTPGTHFCYRLNRPQGHSAIGRTMSMKKLLTPTGIEPATFLLVAQNLNHCATGPKHVENRNKHTWKIVRQVGYLQRSYQAARQTKHKIRHEVISNVLNMWYIC